MTQGNKVFLFQLPFESNRAVTGKTMEKEIFPKCLLFSNGYRLEQLKFLIRTTMICSWRQPR